MNRDQIIRAIEQHVKAEWTYKDDVYLDGVEDAADAIMALDGWQTIDSAPRDGAIGHPAPAWHLFALDARAAITALDAYREEKVG